jgi:hypothetical protein
MADSANPPADGAQLFSVSVQTSDPAQIRVDFNALAKARDAYTSRLLRSGLLPELVNTPAGKKTAGPLAVLLALLDYTRAKASAELFTAEGGRLVVTIANRTICNRTGFARAAVFESLGRLQTLGLVKRLGATLDGATFELLPPPEEDSPLYWGGRVKFGAPPSAPADGGRALRQTGGRLLGQTGGARWGGRGARAGADPFLKGFNPNQSSSSQSAPAAPAAAAGLCAQKDGGQADQAAAAAELAAAILGETFGPEALTLAPLAAAELAADGAAWLSPDYVRAAARQARHDRPNDVGRQVRIFRWMLQAAGRVNLPAPRPTSSAASARSAAIADVDALTTTRQLIAGRLAELAGAGRLAELVGAAIAAAPSAVVASAWRRHLVNPDPAAIAAAGSLGPAIVAMADAPPSPTAELQPLGAAE